MAADVCRQHCAALDITHPGAADYLSQVLATMRGWGIDHFKIDFMYAGGYEGRRHQHVTGVEAFRQALGLIRQAIGPNRNCWLAARRSSPRWGSSTPCG